MFKSQAYVLATYFYYVLIVWRCDKHLGLSKMDLLCRCEWQILHLNVNILIDIVPAGPTTDMPALVHVMAWRWIGSVNSSQSLMAEMTDACHLASMC